VTRNNGEEEMIDGEAKVYKQERIHSKRDQPSPASTTSLASSLAFLLILP
jgi:hypothetical protein